MARQAAVQADLHRQRTEIDQAKLHLLRRQSQTQDQLRVARERLAVRNWWRRPVSQTTSSWVSSGGARATSATPTPAATSTWPSMEQSMIANYGDGDEGEETRTVRLVEPMEEDRTGQDLSMEDITMMEESENMAVDEDRAWTRGRKADRRHQKD